MSQQTARPVPAARSLSPTHSVTAAQLCTASTSGALQAAIDQVLASGASSLLILACTADQWSADQLDPVLNSLAVPVIGGSFPGIIHQDRCLRRGTLVIGLRVKLEIAILRGLATDAAELEDRLRRACSTLPRGASLITLIDGRARNIEQVVEALYTVTGNNHDTIGAGAGNTDPGQQPCLITAQGLLQDVAVIAAYPGKLRRGFSHGWEILDGPYLITGASGNRLETINYTPAFEIYRERVAQAVGHDVNPQDFFAMARHYPLGIEKLGGDILVRDPIQLEDNTLICGGEIPENAMVYVLQGQAGQLIRAATDAAGSAQDAFGPATAAHVPAALVFDCVSRMHFLGDNFGTELQAISRRLGDCQHVFGALALGEIANIRSGPIDLLNCSTVVAVF